MPNVKGRLDHMDGDVNGKHLFVAGLENGTLEVVDLRAGKWMRSIPGFKKPQGALFVPELNKLFVACGDDAMLRVFKSDTLDLLDSIQLERGPNRVVYEPHTKLVYVGCGGKDAGKDYGEVGIIDATDDKHIADIKVSAHPSELLLNKSGSTLFVLISVANQLQVVDTAKRQVVSTWKVSSERPGDAALDESTSRLFAGTRTPPEMIVMDAQSGMKSFTFRPQRVWTEFVSTPSASAFTYREAESCRMDSLSSINRRMSITTSFSEKSLPAPVLAHRSGQQNLIGTL